MQVFLLLQLPSTKSATQLKKKKKKKNKNKKKVPNNRCNISGIVGACESVSMT